MDARNRKAFSTRDRLAAQLEVVEMQIDLAQATLDAQRKLIENMRRKGYATSDAETLLTILANRLAMQEVDGDSLRAKLSELTPP